MKLKLFFILTLFFSTLGIVKPQTLKLGLRYEPGILLSELNSRNEIIPVLFSISSNITFEPNSWSSLIIRPGIILIDEQYSGYDIGAFIKFQLLSTKFYFITGINNHSNKATGHNSAGGYGKNMLFASVGLGFQSDSKFSIDISYSWTNEKDYAYAKLTDNLTYSRFINRYLNGIIKLGLNVTWDIF